MIRLRLDRRLQGRIDSSDVLQDAYLEVARRARGIPRPAIDAPEFLWDPLPLDRGRRSRPCTGIT